MYNSANGQPVSLLKVHVEYGKAASFDTGVWRCCGCRMSWPAASPSPPPLYLWVKICPGTQQTPPNVCLDQKRRMMPSELHQTDQSKARQRAQRLDGGEIPGPARDKTVSESRRFQKGSPARTWQRACKALHCPPRGS